MKPSLLILVLLAVASTGNAATQDPGCITIVGPGAVGGALGKRWAGVGYRIVYGSRTPDSERVRELVAATGADARAMTPLAAAQACDLLLFAVPWEAAEESFKGLGSLAGKIVIDANNPLDVRDGREIALPVIDSAAERLQAWAPGARIVKAFNTLNWNVMENPSIAGGPVSVPLSGDEADAKSRVAELVRAVDLVPVDVGPLRTARYTEQMALLYVSLSVRGVPHEFHLRPR